MFANDKIRRSDRSTPSGKLWFSSGAEDRRLAHGENNLKNRTWNFVCSGGLHAFSVSEALHEDDPAVPAVSLVPGLSERTVRDRFGHWNIHSVCALGGSGARRAADGSIPRQHPDGASPGTDAKPPALDALGKTSASGGSHRLGVLVHRIANDMMRCSLRFNCRCGRAATCSIRCAEKSQITGCFIAL
jgi:hypothetical protein